MSMWIIENPAIKIGALLIALFLWFHAITEKDYEVRRRAPIEIAAVPEELVLAKPIPTEAIVRLKGKGKQLIAPYFSSIRLSIDANWAQEGLTQITLAPEHVHIPHGIGALMVEIITPQKLDLEFDVLVSKSVPVQSGITIEPSEGFVKVGSIILQPDSVLVQGPAQHVTSIDFVTTDSVNYSGAKGSISDVVGLVNPNGFNVTCLPRQVEAAINIQQLVQRTVEQIPVTLTNIPSGITAYLEPGVISLTISGGEDYLTSLTPSDFSVSADYRRALTSAENRISARINLPPQVKLTGASPQTFRVMTGS
jgi:hypothetical protein